MSVGTGHFGQDGHPPYRGVRCPMSVRTKKTEYVANAIPFEKVGVISDW